MAELLVASGSKRITALISVNGISGSTAMPIVMGGNTVQVSHTNFLGTTLLNQSNTFSGNNTFGGQTTLLNGLVNGNLVVKGDLTANQYIISSSVSHITSSFSSGSTIFGDSLDDTHQFTGSVSINGNLNAPSFTGSLSFDNLTNRPTLVSGSSQVSFNGIVDKPTLVSSSQQVISLLPVGTVSGSSQVSFNGIIDKPTLVSSSQQIRDFGIFATTGSNTFRGNQTITGSLSISAGEFNVTTGSGNMTSSLIFDHTQNDGVTLGLRHNDRLSFADSTFNVKVWAGGVYTNFIRNGTTVDILNVEAFDDNKIYVYRDTRLYNKSLVIDNNLTVQKDVLIGTGSLDINNGEFSITSGSGELTSSLSFTHTTVDPITGDATLALRYRNNDVGPENNAWRFVATDNGVQVRYDQYATSNKLLFSVSSFGSNFDKLLIWRDTRLFGRNLEIDGNLHLTGSLLSSGSANYRGDVTASIFTGSFIGDGSGLTGVTAGGVDFDDITNKPTLVSGSAQISFNGIVDKPTLVSSSIQVSYPNLSNIPNGIISSSAQIDLLFDIDGLVSSSQQVLDYDIFTTTSSFNSFTSSYNTGSFTGSFFGDGSGLFTGSFSGDGSGLTGVIETGSFATTGSNTFIGNQIITGSVTISGSISQVGVGEQSIVISDAPITTLTTATGLTAIGYGAGEDITSGYDNTFIGNQAGRDNTTGYVNTFVGGFAGSLNTTGIFNTFVGRAAGQFNTTGTRNTFVGTLAGQVSTGTGNTFLGTSAGALNTTAGSNTFVGNNAGATNSTAQNNTFVGEQAGRYNTSGSGNTFIGQGAGIYNTTANFNAFIGHNAGRDNSVGTNNTFVGPFAGQVNISGSHNTFIGTSAGVANTQASNNTFIGSNAGSNNSVGTDNTFVGRNAGTNTTSGSGNSFFGRQAAVQNNTGANNSTFGFQAGQFNQSGSNNTFFGKDAGSFLGNGSSQNDSADNSVFLGAGTRANGSAQTNQIVIGYQAVGNGSNTVVIGNTSIISTTLRGSVSASLFSGSFVGDGSGLTGVTAGAVDFTNILNKPTLVSSSQQVLDYGIFATTGSNTFSGNQIVTGSTDISGSLVVNNDVEIENGYVVLTRVSQSLEFANDTDAAAGGVPLGGLYRSGNFILIRLV